MASGIKQNIQKTAFKATSKYLLNKLYTAKTDEEKKIVLVKVAENIIKYTNGIFASKSFEKMILGLKDNDNVWVKYAISILNDIDRHILETLIMSLGIETGLFGSKQVRENRNKYHCNIPNIILFDPTSGCNLKCKGCWAADYGHKENLTLDEMRSIVSQGRALGTHFYMMTGGEPLIRKNDIITLCNENQDCAFLCYTNATLIDQNFCDEIKKTGNLILALSIEGTKETNDWRRGEGSYQKTLDAMALLKKNKCFFGISCCYTSQNLDSITNFDFIDKMVQNGAKFGAWFNFMPVGHDASAELIPTPKQRAYMYSWVKKMRDKHEGKPIFIMDFQNDGEHVGGCIAGGRHYFHINSHGDMEPCVFIHFSDSNIREKTILEALKSPLFMAYYHNQPFNDNHLRPCPMLENPDLLRKMIKQTKAQSSDLVHHETVDELCAKCDDFAKNWTPKADELWKNNKHPDNFVDFYRDTPWGKKEIQNNETELL